MPTDPRVRLDAIKQRVDKAPEAPWYIDGGPGSPEVWVDHSGGEYESCSGLVDHLPIWGAGAAEFIAHARQDVPLLVAALEAVLDRVDDAAVDPNELGPGYRFAMRLVGYTITDALGGGTNAAPLTVDELERACPHCRMLGGHTPTCITRVTDALDALGGGDDA